MRDVRGLSEAPAPSKTPPIHTPGGDAL